MDPNESNTQYAVNVTVITGAGDIPGGTLTDGWYLFRGTFSVPNTIVISGAVNIILENGCNVTVTGDARSAGINVAVTNSLKIYAQSANGNAMGALTATGGGLSNHAEGGAGIGSNSRDHCGEITIAGGRVTATGTDFGTGIGGGYRGGCGTIIIAGGIITATGGNGAAGIGVGHTGYGGSITITGGTVNATAVNYGAGIGTSGGNYIDSITITGGTVNATSGDGGAGIGAGISSSVGSITITGGTINASGNNDSAGIGGGRNGVSIKIIITGGTINAKGSPNGAGIGGGKGGGNSTIIITGGTINATGGGPNGAGIGGGIYGIGCGTIIISGGTVTARGGANSACIGGAISESGGSVLIYGEDTVVHTEGGYTEFGVGANGTEADVFVALKYGNLTGPNGPIGNAVKFTADPATNTGKVTAALPAPFNTAPFSTGVIDLMTGLGPNASASIPSKTMSVYTTFDIQSIMFALDDYDNSPVTKTGTELITSGTSVDFRNRPYYVTVNVIGNGSVEVSDGNTVYGTVTASTSGSTVRIPYSVGGIFLKATEDTGYKFSRFIVNSASGGSNPFAVAMDSDKSVTAVFAPVPAAIKQYYIKATSDQNSGISPGGVSVIQKGGDQTFFFSAAAGYSVSSVTVDGVPLTKEQIGLGYYTFRNVMANHHIDVKSSAAIFTLTVEINEGKGRAEYSVNGSPFKAYTGPVTVPAGSSVVLKAYPDKGYGFKEWRTDGTAYSQPEIAFGNIGSSMHFSLYFAEDKGSGSSFHWWIPIVIALIILDAVLIWLFLYRRYFDVIRTGPAAAKMIGEERVLRKREYSFRTEGYSEKASYRIGEKGEWNLLSPDADGTYTIPGNEVTDNIYLK